MLFLSSAVGWASLPPFDVRLPEKRWFFPFAVRMTAGFITCRHFRCGLEGEQCGVVAFGCRCFNKIGRGWFFGGDFVNGRGWFGHGFLFRVEVALAAAAVGMMGIVGFGEGAAVELAALLWLLRSFSSKTVLGGAIWSFSRVRTTRRTSSSGMMWSRSRRMFVAAIWMP